MNRDRMREKWAYKIRPTQGFIFVFILLALFGGLTVWLYLVHNGAYIFTALFTALVLLLLAVGLYRAAFCKIYIGERGFYHQTRPGDGKYYLYTEIREAWVSSGQALNGAKENFCNYITADGQTHKFQIFYKAQDGVAYLVRRVEEAGGGPAEDAGAETALPAAGNQPAHGRWEYQITGKQNVLPAIVMSFIIGAVFTALTIHQLVKPDPSVMGALCYSFTAVVFLGIFVYSLLRWFCFKVYIGRRGFYFRTTPFNGKYYKYTDVKRCRVEQKTYRQNHSADTLYYYYFIFTLRNGKTKKFRFEKPISGREVAVLQERIERAKNPSGPPAL